MAENSMESNFTSIRPAVEFIDILDHYSYNEDLICYYKFNDYKPQEGDRIAIFKLGWNFVKDYIVFEWAPITLTGKENSVTFNKHILPKNNSEIYQICYISGENELHGASCSFQFSSERGKNLSTSIIQPKICKVSEGDLKINTLPSNNEELKKLKEENIMLREALNLITAGKTNSINLENYNKDINDLRVTINNMKLASNEQAQEFQSLKAKMEINEITFGKHIAGLQENINNLESAYKLQLHEVNTLKLKILEGGEEYRKLYLEKAKLEKKIEKHLKNKKDDYKLDSNNFDIEDLPPFPFPKKL